MARLGGPERRAIAARPPRLDLDWIRVHSPHSRDLGNMQKHSDHTDEQLWQAMALDRAAWIAAEAGFVTFRQPHAMQHNTRAPRTRRHDGRGLVVGSTRVYSETATRTVLRIAEQRGSVKQQALAWSR